MSAVLIELLLVGMAASAYVIIKKKKRQAELNDLARNFAKKKPEAAKAEAANADAATKTAGSSAAFAAEAAAEAKVSELILKANKETVEDWKALKESLFDVYGKPDFCLGPLSSDEIFDMQPWNLDPNTPEAIVSQGSSMFFYYEKGLVWSLEMVCDLNGADHAVVIPEPEPPVIRCSFKDGREDELIIGDIDYSAETYVDAFRRFAGLAVELK